MADKSIDQLPVSDSLTDDGLLVVYQNDEAQSIKGELIKVFARDGVEAYVSAAQEAAARAEEVAESVQGVVDDVADAKSAAEAAEAARAAAVVAQAAAEQARDDAQDIAGGDFASEEQVSSQIETHNTDSEAHADIREAVAAVAPLVVTLTSDVPDKTMGEIYDAFVAGTPVFLHDPASGYQYNYYLSRATQQSYYSNNNGVATKMYDSRAYFACCYSTGTTLGYMQTVILECTGKTSLSAVTDSYGTCTKSTFNALTKRGDTMLGALTLSGNPTSNLHAATKQYVDDTVARVLTPLVVTVTDSASDTTAEAVYDAYNDGRPVVLLSGTEAYSLDHFTRYQTSYMSEDVSSSWTYYVTLAYFTRTTNKGVVQGITLSYDAHGSTDGTPSEVLTETSFTPMSEEDVTAAINTAIGAAIGGSY